MIKVLEYWGADIVWEMQVVLRENAHKVSCALFAAMCCLTYDETEGPDLIWTNANLIQ